MTDVKKIPIFFRGSQILIFNLYSNSVILPNLSLRNGYLSARFRGFMLRSDSCTPANAEFNRRLQ